MFIFSCTYVLAAYPRSIASQSKKNKKKKLYYETVYNNKF